MFHAYKNGNYSVIIFDDGTKIRRTNEDEFIPSFAENCDVKITDKCSQGCSFCYEGCSVSGKHADLFNYAFLNTLHPYTEMALNGNDLDHPKLKDFLEFLKTKKVFANLTVNQNQFMKNIDKLKEWTDSKLIYGLGVSLVNPGENFIKEVKRFPNAVIHTIAGILTSEDILRLQKKDLKVLILGYKDLSRGSEFLKRNRDEIQSRLNYLRKILPCAISDGWFKVISFDNLAIKQLNVRMMMPEEQWDEFYMGDDGGYTFYIDMVAGTYAKNSISNNRYPINNLSIDEMFNNIKTTKNL